MMGGATVVILIFTTHLMQSTDACDCVTKLMKITQACNTIGGVMIRFVTLLHNRNFTHEETRATNSTVPRTFDIAMQWPTIAMQYPANTAAQFSEIIDALPTSWSEAFTGIAQVDDNAETGGHYHFVGKSVTHNIELPDQHGPNRFDYFTDSSEPDDPLSLLGILLGYCKNRPSDILFVRRLDRKVFDNPEMCTGTLGLSDPTEYSVICQYDMIGSSAANYKAIANTGMLKDIIGVRTLLNMFSSVDCGKECSKYTICSMYSYDKNTKTCRISFIPFEQVASITDPAATGHKSYVKQNV